MTDLADSKLGLQVPPVDVRIHPRNQDGYRWSVLPQKEHLFEKNLSKLSTGTYIQIMEGIGVFFEAVSKNRLPTPRASYEPLEGARENVAVTLTISQSARNKFAEYKKVVSASIPEDSFTAKITQLQGQVSTLHTEAQGWQTSAEKESQQRLKLEAELGEAKSAVLALQTENVRLKKRYKKVRKQAVQLRFKVDEADKGIQQLVSITRKLAAISEAPLSPIVTSD